MKEKGIEDAINYVILYNKIMNKVCYKLDIYGPIDKKYEKCFQSIIKNAPEYINYKGIVNYNESVNVLEKYDIMLFLTKYDIEGVPGTIIDAFFSGIPIITTSWRSVEEIIKNNKTGWIINKKQLDSIIDIFNTIYYNKNIIINMKKNCILEAEKYLPKMALKELFMHLI